MKRRTLYGLAGVLWVGALTWLSFLPGNDKQLLHTKGRLHSPGHFVAFFISAIVLLRVVRSPKGRVVMIGALVALSFGLEITQSLLNHDAVEWHDVVVDLLGATLGSVMYALIGGMRDRSGVPRQVISRWRRRQG